MTPPAEAKAVEPVAVSRWRLKHTIANLLRVPEGEKAPGVCKCGAAGHEVLAVDLVRRDGNPGVSGVFFCDSPWLCPTCAPRRAGQRAEKVQQVFNATERQGGQVVFVTLTTQHAKGDSLADLKDLVMVACRKARQGKPWKLAVDRYGIQGVMVGPEVTYSAKAGWHFHLHLAVPMKAMDEGAAEAGGEWLIERYRSYILAEGGRADRKAQDVTVVWRQEDLAAYLAKGSAAWEVTSAGATKQGKSGMTPWDLAARAGRGDAHAAKRFQEYAAAMPGTRSCVITKALADKLGIAPNADADTPSVVEVEPDQTVEFVGSVETYRWHRLLRHGHVADVLKAVGDYLEWSEIEGMIRRKLGEEEPSDMPIQRRHREHAPTVEDIARATLSEAYRHRGRKGAALQVVLDRERDRAKNLGLPIVFPDLRSVLERMAA